MTKPALFSPFEIRDVALRNRLVVSPMCQYSAVDGMANDWHLVQLGRFALGGFGTVMVEATAVAPEGRITPGDVGLWSDAHAAPLARIAAFLKANGAAPAIQLAHAGRKASAQRPWEGDGPLTAADAEERGDAPWPVIAPSAVPHAEGWQTPTALDEEGMRRLVDAWRDAAKRALDAGFEIVEVHGAHGYLLNSFLSPVANRREDGYGGDFEGRTRFPLEVIAAVREVWPQRLPVFVRVSASDFVEGGWTADDTVAFAQRLKAIGVDVMDCSGGGVSTKAKIASFPGYQVPFAERVRKEAGLASMAVGLITDPAMAEAIVSEGRADLVALGREALVDPQWPLHAERALGGDPLDFGLWPVQAGHWLRNREKARRAG